MKCASVQRQRKCYTPKNNCRYRACTKYVQMREANIPSGAKSRTYTNKNACVGEALRGKSKPHMQKELTCALRGQARKRTHSRRVQRRREAVEDQHKETGPINANSTTQRMRTPGANYNSDNNSAYSRRVQQQQSQCTLEAQSVEKAAPQEKTKMGVDDRYTYDTQYITPK